MAKNFKPRGSWRDKLEKEQKPQIVSIPPKSEKIFGKGKMLIPTPLQIDELICQIPQGKVALFSQLRAYLAWKHQVQVTCPLVSGIFLRIVAETAEEDRAKGKKEITPYWRVLKDKGSLNAKFPGEFKLQRRKLEDEGFRIVAKKEGQIPRVENFEQHLFVYEASK